MRRFTIVLALIGIACLLIGGGMFFSQTSPAVRAIPFVSAADAGVTTVGVSNVITASARGEAEVSPDVATITTGSVQDASTGTAAQAAVRAVISQTISNLNALNIPNNQIQTINISVEPRYSTKDTITGYEASQVLQVTVSDVQGVGKIADAMAKAGATTGMHIDYGLRDPNTAYLIALTKATRIAASHAAAMAAALGKALTNAKVQIAESGPVVEHRTPLTITSPGGLLDFRVDVLLSYTF